MNIKKGLRAAVTPDYWKYRFNESRMNSAIPKGMPKVTKGDKTPVGPNRYEQLTAEERKTASPDYPVKYSIPVKPGKMGFKPSGQSPSFTTGPGLLCQEDRVPGKFNYEEIPDLRVLPKLKPGESLTGTSLERTGKQGIPAHPETGLPTLPRSLLGEFSLSEEPAPIRRISELDVPVRRAPVDPYAVPD